MIRRAKVHAKSVDGLAQADPVYKRVIAMGMSVVCSLVMVLTKYRYYPAWISYLQTSVLTGTLALALFNASKDEVARNFAYAYAVFSIAVLVSVTVLEISTLLFREFQVYGYTIYQHRITMIRRRDPGHFGAIVMRSCTPELCA